MLITSHIAATTGLLVGANYLGVNPSTTTILVTYLLGVGIDLDHAVFKHKKSIKRFKEYKNNPKDFVQGKENLHTILQEPITVVVIFIISLLAYLLTKNITVFLPAIALSIHVLMDSLLSFENQLLWPFTKKGFKGPFQQKIKTEAIIGTILSIVLVITLLKQLASI
ncbi:metal-dependent hydrolase [Patescibacteria group bacterium]